MTFHQPGAQIYIPDSLPFSVAFERISHLGIGAHQDDLEFMAFHGIIACYDHPTNRFGGVTCTDGVGSPRTGALANLDDAGMRALRREEQNQAARLGRYGVMVQLDYLSAAIKNAPNPWLTDDLEAVLRATRPGTVYTHNLADKHPTHVAVALAALAAIWRLPSAERPTSLYGCEVWRDLDWLPDHRKVVHDLSGYETLADTLNAVFVSQVGGGKRYDLAVAGRRRANATFGDPRHVDGSTSLAYAMDLTPLVHDDSLDPADYVETLLAEFCGEVLAGLGR